MRRWDRYPHRYAPPRQNYDDDLCRGWSMIGTGGGV